MLTLARMADDVKPPAIDPALLEAARANGADVDVPIDRTLRQNSPKTRSDDARAAAAAIVDEYNARCDREGPWIEALRNWNEPV